MIVVDDSETTENGRAKARISSSWMILIGFFLLSHSKDPGALIFDVSTYGM
jgi:hypothetical protein